MDKISIEEKMRFIGIAITGGEGRVIKKTDWVDIEQTIYEATLLVSETSRFFLVLCSWVKVHGEYVITEKLMKLQKKQKSPWLVALAIFAESCGHHKWSRLIEKIDGEYALSSLAAAKAGIEYHGEMEIYKKTAFRFDKKSLRVRESEVQDSPWLLKYNRQYRNRFLYGANWRSDIILAIESGFETPYRISKVLGCSYHPAHRIFREYTMARNASAF